MINEKLDQREIAFLDELRKYEDKWVAILKSGDEEIIVGSGNDAVEAAANAKANGLDETVLFYVKPFNKSYLLLYNSSFEYKSS
jgi:Family of unknown function (DUF5678)